MAEGLSLRAYAAHRKEHGLHGTTHTAVRKAIEDGRLEGAAEKGPGGRWRIDAAKADQLWAEQTVLSKQRGDAGRGGRPRKDDLGPLFDGAERPEQEVKEKGAVKMRDAQTMQAAYKAQLTKLEYLERSGQLVRAAQVRTEQFTLARQVREAVLQVPDRVAALLAAETDELQVRNVLNGELSEALRVLAREIAHGAG